MPKPKYIKVPNTEIPSYDENVLNVLMGARDLHRSSSHTKFNAPVPKLAEHVDIRQYKKGSSKEHLLPPVVAEPPSQHAKRVTFSKQRRPLPTTPQHTVKDSDVQTGLTSCLITNPSLDPRASGGANNPAERKVGWLARTDSECQFKAPGLMFLQEKDTNVVTFEVKMRDSVQSVHDYTTKCNYFPKFEDKRKIKDQATQTLYRESSAQTVAYLPDICDKEQDEHLELFNLSNLLPGDKAPGLYEVEILERARKRWAFNEALKTNFRQQLDDARNKAMKTEFRPILEAFEWEHWIEREEYIQECQMMRLEIVIRMFDKREMEMHNASKQRIEEAYFVIEKRRQHGLHKNKIEYQRALRRLQISNSGLSRRWVKQSPMQALGNPCSEFWGPLLRHGVDPARRNFVGDGRKAFDMRMDALENRVNMEKLICPFSKLKEWSKPKEYVKEYEQHFCSEKNLEILYKSLKELRLMATKPRTVPRCLKKRPKPPSSADSQISFNYEGVDATDYFKDRARRTDSTFVTAHDHLTGEQINAITRHLEDEERRKAIPNIGKQMQIERRTEDLEQLLHKYEGTAIGWIMQFLSEEMERLKEQRKLHFFSILAQKERWRREASEAGLRQKENYMRLLYEDIFQQTNAVHSEITEEYIHNILTTDMGHIAACDATESVVKLAKQIDEDIRRWLQSFKVIQTPLTYRPLREMLRSMVSPDLDAQLIKYEKNLIVQYIIDDILFPGIWDELESYDIATTMTSDFIDRLIDNDLYLFSTDSESDEPKRKGWYEAEAILRKLIRQAVPGRRWKTETERVVHENCESLFDDIFERIMNKQLDPMEPIELRASFSEHVMNSSINIHSKREIEEKSRGKDDDDDQPDTQTKLLKSQLLSLKKKMKSDNITKALEPRTVSSKSKTTEFTTVSNIELMNEFIKMDILNRPSNIDQDEDSDLYSIKSTLDIMEETDLKELRHAKQHDVRYTNSHLSLLGVVFDSQKTQTKLEDEAMSALRDLVGDTGISEYEADDEGSSWKKVESESEGYWQQSLEEEILNVDMTTETTEAIKDGQKHESIEPEIVDEVEVEAEAEVEVENDVTKHEEKKIDITDEVEIVFNEGSDEGENVVNEENQIEKKPIEEKSLETTDTLRLGSINSPDKLSVNTILLDGDAEDLLRRSNKTSTNLYKTALAEKLRSTSEDVAKDD